MKGIFYKDKGSYQNTFNPFNAYIEQAAQYVSVMKSIPYEVAREKVIKVLKDNFQDKKVVFLEREENGDRVPKETSLSSYIIHNLKEGNVIAPTLTTYISYDKKKSILAEFISENVKKRAEAKKIAHQAKADGNKELEVSKNNEQSMMKIYNNSLSGAFAQKGCILYNPTAHSTLTSITRTITSLSNATNEKLIAGNRYYPRPKDVLNNIIYISTYANLAIVKEAMEYFNLHYPTVDETIAVLKRSSDLYFTDERYYNEYVRPYLERLTKEARAAICYINDLYHIRVFNSDFVRNLLDKLTTQVRVDKKEEDIVEKIKSLDPTILNFVHMIFYDEVKGLGKDYEKMNEKGIAESLYYTALHIEEVIKEYSLFFRAFFLQDILPNNSFRLKYMRRRAVVLSDTDSTCFTLGEWINWYKGSNYIETKTIAIASSIAFIAAQVIIHQLAILSSTMNISKEHLHVLAMKNEFLWLTHVPCEISKHYFASVCVQEGNVFAEPELEVKGVHLKSSAVPKHLIEDGKRIMTEIVTTIMNNGKIKLNSLLEHVVNVERAIKDSVYKGEATYLRKSKIKSKEAYALDEIKSPFQRHQFWVDVFEPKYGKIQEPPYDVYKIPTTLNNKQDLKAWLEMIEDNELKLRLFNWLNKYNKSSLTTLYLNESFVEANGYPEEIILIIDIKRIILDVTIQYRVILEALGLIIDDEKTIEEQFLVKR